MIAERLERMQRRYMIARTVGQWVTAVAVLALVATITFVAFHQVTLERHSAQRQTCLIDLVYAVIDPSRGDSIPPIPESCEGIEREDGPSK